MSNPYIDRPICTSFNKAFPMWALLIFVLTVQNLSSAHKLVPSSARSALGAEGKVQNVARKTLFIIFPDNIYQTL